MLCVHMYVVHDYHVSIYMYFVCIISFVGEIHYHCLNNLLIADIVTIFKGRIELN